MDFSNEEASIPNPTILTITSYALRGAPLDFDPDIHVNACRLINPPLELRQAYDGRCESLRRNIRADPVFAHLLSEARPQIFGAEETNRALIVDDETDVVKIVEVKVAVACVRGRHRSVSVAEELARLDWPAHYDVRVHHRDVETPHHYQERHRKNLELENQNFNVDDRAIEDHVEDEHLPEDNDTTPPHAQERCQENPEPENTSESVQVNDGGVEGDAEDEMIWEDNDISAHHDQQTQQKSPEHESKTHDVDVDDCGAEYAVEDESGGEEIDASETDGRHSETEPKSTQWWDNCKDELSKVDSKDLEKPKGPGSTNNPLHLPS